MKPAETFPPGHGPGRAPEALPVARKSRTQLHFPGDM
jgi:hypothetical protein